ncbi:MAG: DUF6455 family protein [Hyphomicrobiales bacterium]
MDFSSIVRRWRQRRSNLRELDALGPNGLGVVARDIAVPDDVLYRLVDCGAVEEDLLPRLLQAVALDRKDLLRKRRAVMRDMAVICSGCTMVKRCRRELDQRSAWLRYGQYCPNAETIDALLREEVRGLTHS